MKASAALKLSSENKTKIDKVKANKYIKDKVYARVKTDATNGNYCSFVDIPKELDVQEYHEYIIDNLTKVGYTVNITTLYDKKVTNAFRVKWGKE